MSASDMTLTLNAIESNPGSFTGGTLIKIHTMGRYQVLEFMPKPAKVWRNGGYVDEQEALAFYAYVDGKDTNMGAKTLEGAFLLSMAAGNVPKNDASNAARYAGKILNILE